MRVRLILLAVMAAFLAALLAGCAGDSESGGAPTTTTPETGIKEGGVLRIGADAPVDVLNMFVETSRWSEVVLRATYPTLLQYNPEGEISGNWASDWEVSADGLVWTFTLRPGEWSDGQPLTSADALWTLETLVKYMDGPTAFLGFVVGSMTSFEAPDPQTFVITFDSPLGAAPDLISRILILPKHVWEPQVGTDGGGLQQYNAASELPMVSAGPFIVTEWDSKGTTILEKNPSYYGDDKPHVDAIAIQWFANTDAQVQALLSGEIDFVQSLPPNSISTLEEQGKTEILDQIGPMQVGLLINSDPKKQKQEELLNPDVRLALDYAVNRDEIAEIAFGGFAKPAAAHISPAVTFWSNPDVKPLPFDIDEANRILDDLGYERGSDGIRVTPDGEQMKYEIVAVATDNRVVEAINSGFEQIGVSVTLTAVDFATLFGTLQTSRNYDLGLVSHLSAPDPSFLLTILSCGAIGGLSTTGYCDEEYDALYEQQRSELDQEARKQLVFQMQELIYEDRPYIYTVAPDLVSAWAKNWDGFLPLWYLWSTYYVTSPHQVQ